MSSIHLFLSGYRCTGKSSTAEQLGQLLARPVLDLDQIIVDNEGQSIRVIFDQGGESLFRKLETIALEQAVTATPSIISLGGGTLQTDFNRQLVKSTGKVVLLTAAVDTLARRIQADEHSQQSRPPLTEFDLRTEIETVLADRLPIYNTCADYSVSTDDLSPPEVAEQIAKWWHSVDK